MVAERTGPGTGGPVAVHRRLLAPSPSPPVPQRSALSAHRLILQSEGEALNLVQIQANQIYGRPNKHKEKTTN